MEEYVKKYEVDTFRDGGTVDISQNNITIFCINKMMGGEENKHAVYACYPTEGVPISGMPELKRAHRVLTEAVQYFRAPNELIGIAEGLTWINKQIRAIENEAKQKKIDI